MEERLKLFLAMEGLSPSQFADKLGVQRSGVSHLLSGRNKPSFEFISKMMVAFPKINPDWLIMGTGKAYRDFPTSAAQVSEPQPAVPSAPAADMEDMPDELISPTLPNTEAILEENTVNNDELGLFSAHTAPKPAAETAETAPRTAVAAANPAQNIPAAAPAPQIRQAAAPQSIAAPQPQKYPAENRVKQQPAPAANGKRIVQITILYSDGTFEVR